jgi:hypothetical protein
MEPVVPPPWFYVLVWLGESKASMEAHTNAQEGEAQEKRQEDRTHCLQATATPRRPSLAFALEPTRSTRRPEEERGHEQE